MKISHSKVLAGIVVAGLALWVIAGSAFYVSVRAQSHQASPPSEETSLPEPGPEPAPGPAPAQTEEPTPEPEPAPPEEPAPTPEPEPPSLPFEFPIPELGDCGGVDACRAYCDDLANKDACVAFGAEHGLITREEAELAEELPETGPGDCASADACQSYCDDPAHQAECTDFAVSHDIISEDEAEQVEILATTGGPGGCSSPEACEAFCSDPAHHQACLAFAEVHGLVSQDEVREIEELRDQAQDLLAGGKIGPGGCRDEASCRAYCEDSAHLDQCLAFAQKHDFISPDEAHRIRKAGFTTGPGGCKGEAACRAYCEVPTNQLICVDWAVENGFMTAEEAAIARKMAGKTGPGGCQGEACREYCENPAHTEACLEFAATEGIIPPEEIERARKFIKITAQGGPGGCTGIQCKTYCQDPAHQDDCFDFAKKNNLIPPEVEKDYAVGKKIRQKMAESGGPGGCKNDNECRVYCTDPGHVEECVAFGASHGGVPPEEVRRMLKEFTQGRFQAHGEFGPPEDFRRFEEESRKRFEEFRQLETHFRGGPPTGFPGAPGEFPGAPSGFPGGPPAGPGFVGPGGCASPAECIKYCTEHREECFSFGPPGIPEARPPEGGIPPGHEIPQLQEGLIRPVPSETRARGSAAISLEKQPNGLFLLRVRAANGIQDFSLALASGSNYGAGLASCPSGYENNTVTLRDSDFPISVASVTDCSGTRHSVTIGPPYGGGAVAVPMPPIAPTLPQGLVPAELPVPQELQQQIQRQLEEGAERCRAAGGTWDGSSCHFPSTTQPHARAPIQSGVASSLNALWGFFGFR